MAYSANSNNSVPQKIISVVFTGASGEVGALINDQPFVNNNLEYNFKPRYDQKDSDLVLWYRFGDAAWVVSTKRHMGTANALICSNANTEKIPASGWKTFSLAEMGYVSAENIDATLTYNTVSEQKDINKKDPTLAMDVDEEETSQAKPAAAAEELTLPAWRTITADFEHNPELLTLLLSSDVTVSELLAHFHSDAFVFKGTVVTVVDRKVIERLTSAVKLKLIVAAIIVKDFEFLDYLLALKRFFSIPEVAKALRLLDAPRKIRQKQSVLTRRLAKHGLANYEELTILKAEQQAAARNQRLANRGRRYGRRNGRGANKKDDKGIRDTNGKRIAIGKLSKLKVEIHNLQKDMDVTDGVSVSGALQKRFWRWVRTLSAEELEFFLLNFGSENWKIFADIVHPNPNDFACDYFLACQYEQPPPPGSLVAMAQSATMANITELLTQEPRLCNFYAYLRTRLQCQENTEPGPPMGEMPIDVLDITQSIKTVLKNQGYEILNDLARVSRQELQAPPCNLTYSNVSEIQYELQNWGMDFRAHDAVNVIHNVLANPTKAIIARQAPMEDVLWRYEELTCPETDAVLCERLQNDNVFNPNHARSNYGKLMERILTFRDQHKSFVPHLIPHAEHRLSEILVPNTGLRVAVLGDKSGSMEVAIRSSCIVSSLLAVAFGADLKFFDEAAISPSVVPRSVPETIQVVDEIQAEGGTSMAAGLGYYLDNGISIDLLVLVSDEKEVSKYKNMYFHQTVRRYQDEVNAELKIFLVSFLSKDDPGELYTKLRSVGIEVEQFRFDATRPDTSKFAALMGQLSLHTGPTLRKIRMLQRCLHDFYGIDEHVGQVVWSFL